MKKSRIIHTAVAAGLLLSGALAPSSQAQTADALINKLLDKGILTVQEANQLREEADNDYARAHAAKTGLPEWVSQMKLYGDVRGRIENIGSDNDNSIDRTRYRIRMRLGVAVQMWDNLEAGVRFATSDPDAAISDPISSNSTLQYNGSRKFMYLDLAYGKWTPVHRNGWTVSGTVGKMENPFVVSDMVFDGDYNPEGAALQAAYQINDQHTLKFNGAGFALNELSASSRDAYMLGTQLRWDGKYGQREGYYVWESALGVSWYGLNSADTLSNTSVPNVNVGNTRDENGVLVYHYNPIVLDASLTYYLSHMPYYNGVFPIKLGGELMHNPAVPSKNTGWWVGVTFGKAGKKRTWEVSYRYKYLEADAWWEEVVDSDFGGYYEVAQPGGKSGYRAGTNVKGHIIRASYSPYDALNLTVTYFLTDLINSSPSGSKSDAHRLQVDATWKF